MEENNLDKYFQEKLAGHTEEPPPAVWEGISSKLPKSGFVWNKRYLLLLLMLISFGGATFLGIRLYEMDSRVAELENKIKTEKSESISETNENITKTSDQNAGKSSATEVNSAAGTSSTKSREIEQSERESNTDKDFIENSEGGHSAQAASTLSRSSDFDGATSKTDQSIEANSTLGLALTPGTSRDDSESVLGMTGSKPIETVQGQPNSQENVEVKPTTSGSSSSLAFNPTLLSSISPFLLASPEFTGRERDVDYFTEPGKDWYLFLYGMANYTHRRVVAQAEGAETIPNQLDKIENGLITPGAGLQVSREIGKHFRLSLGVEYNQWIQEGTYDIQVPVEEITIGTNTVTQLSEFNFSGEIASAFGSNSYNSSSAENPFGEEFTTLTPGADPFAFQLQTRRRIDYLSIPVTLEYVYKTYPFRLTVGGGISVNHIIGSEFSFDTNPDASGFDVGEVNDVEGTYISFQAGLGVEYGISERISLRINPSYRGWMTPIFENEEIRTLPFGVTIKGGVVYRLGN